MKTNELGEGNEHLEDLPIHKDENKFYAKVKEFNAEKTLVMKHPLSEIQMKIQRKRTTKELINPDLKDPISGHRQFRTKDDSRFPASKIIVTNGHHRLYELYRRYLQDKINGDLLVTFIIE